MLLAVRASLAVVNAAGAVFDAIRVEIRNTTREPLVFRSLAFLVKGTGMQLVGTPVHGDHTVHTIAAGAADALVYSIPSMLPRLQLVTDAAECVIVPVVRVGESEIQAEPIRLRIR